MLKPSAVALAISSMEVEPAMVTVPVSSAVLLSEEALLEAAAEEEEEEGEEEVPPQPVSEKKIPVAS